MSLKSSTICLVLVCILLHACFGDVTVPNALIFKSGGTNAVTLNYPKINPKNASSIMWDSTFYIQTTGFDAQSATLVKERNLMYLLIVPPGKSVTQLAQVPIGAADPNKVITLDSGSSSFSMLEYNPFLNTLTMIRSEGLGTASFCQMSLAIEIDPAALKCKPYSQLDYSSLTGDFIPMFIKTPNGTIAYLVGSINAYGSLSVWVDELDAAGFPLGRRLWGPKSVTRSFNYIRTGDCTTDGSRILCTIVNSSRRPWTGTIAELKIPFGQSYADAIYVPINPAVWYPMSPLNADAFSPPVLAYDAGKEVAFVMYPTVYNLGMAFGEFSTRTAEQTYQVGAPLFGDQPGRIFAL